jgi:hypothetical protein
MNAQKLFGPVLVVAVGLAAAVGSLAIAATSGDPQPAGQSEMQLPPGWTAEDMQSVLVAGTPGKMHEHLAQGVGVWKGKTTMWMTPDTEPLTGTCMSTVKSIMDGRFTKCELAGECPAMGPYNGVGISGFDNVAQRFVSTWVDNHGTGIMVGEGELSSDGKVLTWEFKTNCPITKKPAVMREIEMITGPTTKSLEMFGTDPKTGKEFKMMHIEFTKQ